MTCMEFAMINIGNSLFAKPLFQPLPSWSYSFGVAVRLLQVASRNVSRDVHSIRLVTDHSIPTWLPVLPAGIVCQSNSYPKGEIIFSSENEPFSSCLLETSGEIIDKGPNIILYIHGGAFCLCNPATHRSMLSRLAQETGAVIFAVDYRRPPEDPYPAPLDDCVAAYEWLLRKVPPSRIVFAGDSAGGGLAVSTVLKGGQNLPPPAGCILLSPWVDLEDNGRMDSWTRNKAYDYLPPDLGELFAGIYKGSHTWSEVSPILFDNLGDLPPVLIECGEREVLVDQILAFASKCIRQGVEVDVHVREDMVHVFPMFAFANVPQCDAAFASMKAFVASVTTRGGPADATSLPIAVDDCTGIASAGGARIGSSCNGKRGQHRDSVDEETPCFEDKLKTESAVTAMNSADVSIVTASGRFLYGSGSDGD